MTCHPQNTPWGILLHPKSAIFGLFGNIGSSKGVVWAYNFTNQNILPECAFRLVVKFIGSIGWIVIFIIFDKFIYFIYLFLFIYIFIYLFLFMHFCLCIFIYILLHIFCITFSICFLYLLYLILQVHIIFFILFYPVRIIIFLYIYIYHI